MESIHTILMHSQLRWAGHVHRMDDCRFPTRILYGKLSTGKCSLGRPKLRYKDTLKASPKQCCIPYTTWEESAEDRPAWHSLVKSGVATFEERRIRDKEKKRQRRKDTENSSSQLGSAPHIPCPHCNRLFRAKVGLISHLRTHPTPRDMKSWSSLLAKDEHTIANSVLCTSLAIYHLISNAQLWRNMNGWMDK